MDGGKIMAQLITEPANESPGTADWQRFLFRTTAQGGGFICLGLTGMGTIDEPEIMSGSRLEVNGSFYAVGQNNEAIDGTVDQEGAWYIYAVPDEDALTWRYSQAAPVFDPAKGGFYDGKNRAVAKFLHVNGTFGMKIIFTSPDDFTRIAHDELIPDDAVGVNVFECFENGSGEITLDPGYYRVKLIGPGGGGGGGGNGSGEGSFPRSGGGGGGGAGSIAVYFFKMYSKGKFTFLIPQGTGGSVASAGGNGASTVFRATVYSVPILGISKGGSPSTSYTSGGNGGAGGNAVFIGEYDSCSIISGKDGLNAHSNSSVFYGDSGGGGGQGDETVIAPSADDRAANGSNGAKSSGGSGGSGGVGAGGGGGGGGGGGEGTSGGSPAVGGGGGRGASGYIGVWKIGS
jgi:hypothetical protein